MRWSIPLLILWSCSAPNQLRSGSVTRAVPDGHENIGKRPVDQSDNADPYASVKGPAGPKPEASPPASPVIRPTITGPTLPGSTANGSAAAASDESEAALPPSPINGSFLHCIVQLEPTELLTEGSVACRLEDKSNNRVDPAGLNVLAHYSVTLPNIIGAESHVTPLAHPDRLYDVTIAFKALTKSDAAKAMHKSQLQVDMTSLDNTQLIASQRNSILTYETKAPIPKWKILSEGGPDVYLDAASGLLWKGDDQGSFSFQEALSYCSSYQDMNAVAWVVPSLAQLTIARNHGIGSRPDVGLEMMNLKSGSAYWTTNRYKSPNSTGDQVVSLELLIDTMSSVSPPSLEASDARLPVLCVAVP